jgi:O-antigen ligase/polysaccharide polymerase Wzy-like membrane protein
VEHSDAAQVAAVLGALGGALVLLGRGRAIPLAGFALLGVATALLGRSLVGDDDLDLIFGRSAGIALIAAALALTVLVAAPLVRYPTVIPVALLVAAPFRIPVELGAEEAFLLLPLYLVIAASVVALAYRMLRGWIPPRPAPVLALPLALFAAFSAISFLWTHDEREGGIALAFFLFPFLAGFGVLTRSPLPSWLPRALAVTLVSLGSLFAAIGLWQAETRTLFFARDLEVANAYTTFFRVASVFKDPSQYGRYLVVPIAILLVVLLLSRRGPAAWIGLTALIGLLFAGLYFSYSQSSFVALFIVTFAIAFIGASRPLRIALVACVIVAALAAAAFAAQAADGRSAREVTSGRSRLVSITLDAFEVKPVVGVGIGGQPRVSAEENGRRSAKRSASHTTPLTVLAELGIVGFALYIWTLAAAGWVLVLVARRDQILGVGLGAVLLVLFVHSLLYAGFFEDPLTWGVLGLGAAVVGSLPAPAPKAAPSPSTRLAH